MQTPVVGEPARHRHHHRHHRRRRPFWKRVRGIFEMPGRTQRERNQRLAIIGVVVMVGLYLLLSPILERAFPQRQASTAPATAKPFSKGR